MSALFQMVTTWDEAALTGLVSKGVVIRAGKDAPKTTVQMSDDTATVTTGDVTVTLTAPDLKSARCSCGLPFACRHVVTAVLALRLIPADPPEDSDTATAPHKPRKAAPASGNSSAKSPPKPAKIPPVVDVAALSFAAIEKHAGKDWPRALSLTAEPVQITGGSPERGNDTGTRSVTFVETNETVTFPNGLALKDALFKGTKPSRTRLVVAAAALVLARQEGRALPENIIEGAPKTVDLRTLDRAETALFNAVRALSAGAVAQAADHLFNLAISTRAEAVPRLAAELRGLSRRMTEEALRKADETPETLLLVLSRSHALIRALRKTPDDTALIGRLARSFDPSGPMDVTFLGAESWRTPAGARGMTLAFLDLKTQRIHRVTEARAAGSDLNYQAGTTWNKPLWSAAPPQNLHGRVLHLADAAMAPDGGLGLNQTATDTGAAPDTLPGARDWSGLGDAFDRQMGCGLRRLAGEAFVVLAPKTTQPPEFDPYTQKWFWTWFDDKDTPIALQFPKDIRQNPDIFAAYARRIGAGLVALSPKGDARLLSVWITGGGAGHYVLQFNHLPKPKGWTAFVDRVRKHITLSPTNTLTPVNPLRLCLDRVAETALSSLGRPTTGTLNDHCRALGLSHIADGVDALDGSPEAALRLGYLLALAQDALGEVP